MARARDKSNAPETLPITVPKMTEFDVCLLVGGGAELLDGVAITTLLVMIVGCPEIVVTIVLPVCVARDFKDRIELLPVLLYSPIVEELDVVSDEETNVEPS